MYIYPPRPETKVPRSGLHLFDNKTFLGQPKYDGSCAELYLGGEDTFKSMNRHKSELTGFRISRTEARSLVHNHNLNLFVGEYMNKSKKDHSNKVFNHKLVLFDILILNGKHLLGYTNDKRVEILYDMFKFVEETDYFYRITENIYLTKSFDGDFCNLWDKFTKVDMIEGLVMKRKDSALTPGVTEKNNLSYKCRRETKNYNY